MCRQLRGKWQESGRGVGIGICLLHCGRRDYPSLRFLLLWSFYFPLSLPLSPLSATLWGPLGGRGRRGRVSHPLSLRGTVTSLVSASGSARFFPLRLPHFFSLLTGLTSLMPPAGSWPGGQVPVEL